MEKIKEVGDHITDGSGVEWVIVRAWDWPKWVDFDIMNVKTGEWSYLRELKE